MAGPIGSVRITQGCVLGGGREGERVTGRTGQVSGGERVL